MKEADFKASFDHLAHSLDNTQGTIRFVDKKIGSAMALLTAVVRRDAYREVVEVAAKCWSHTEPT